MNLLVVTAIYSGLADSLASGRWQPRGVPAVYRLLEGLAARKDVTTSYVFLSRAPDPRFAKAERRTVPPLGDRAWVLPWRPWPLLDRLGLGNALREFEQAIRVIAIALRTRPNVVYCTNAAYIAGSLLARLRIAPVVIRFLGLFPVHRQMVERRAHAFARWFYRAPFARAVCTLEGSGGEYYLPKLMRSDVRCDVMMNGVDRPAVDPAAVAALKARVSPKGLPIIGYLGRLEPFKGCEDFVEALFELERKRPCAFVGLIVGDGPLKESLEARIDEAKLTSRIIMTGGVPHKLVAEHLAALDVYVSLNRYGNLSNANLEAMIGGRCMLMLDGDAAEHIDQSTDRLIPRSVVERIPRTGTANALAGALARLIDDPNEIRRRAQAMAGLAGGLLTGWNDRIAREIATVISVGRPGAAAAQPQIESVE